MSNETFHFKSGSVHDVVSVLETKRGQAALHEVEHSFSSLAQVIAAAHPSSDGASTIVTLPNQNTITLAGLSEREIKADAKQLGHILYG